jgi:hypothetical protein
MWKQLWFLELKYWKLKWSGFILSKLILWCLMLSLSHAVLRLMLGYVLFVSPISGDIFILLLSIFVRLVWPDFFSWY